MLQCNRYSTPAKLLQGTHLCNFQPPIYIYMRITSPIMIVPLKITLWDDQTQLKRMSYGIKQGWIESQVMPTWNMHSLQLNMRLYIYTYIYIYQSTPYKLHHSERKIWENNPKR